MSSRDGQEEGLSTGRGGEHRGPVASCAVSVVPRTVGLGNGVTLISSSLLQGGKRQAGVVPWGLLRPVPGTATEPLHVLDALEVLSK